jgi:hypothetical protein
MTLVGGFFGPHSGSASVHNPALTDTFSDRIIVQLPMELSHDDLGVRRRLEEELEAAFAASESQATQNSLPSGSSMTT